MGTMDRFARIATRRVASSLAAAIAFGCSSADAPSASPFAREDSSGIEIVTSLRPAADDSVVDLTAAQPAWTFGGGPEAAVPLFQVRGVIPVGDTMLAIANGQPAEVLVVLRSGDIIRRFGGNGEGPGEYGFMWYPWLAPPDTIVVFDPALRRVTLTHINGEVARIDPLMRAAEQAPADILTTLVWGRFSDGSYLITPNQRMPPDGGEPGVSLRTITRYDPTTETLHTIALLPYAEADAGEDGEAELFTFAPLAMNLPNGDRLITGLPTSFEYDVRTLSGELLRRVRRSWQNIEVTERHVEAHQADLPAREAESERERRERLQSIRYRQFFPAYDRYALVAREGDVWIPHYPLPGSGSDRWTVFDSTGVWMRDVVVPRNVRPRAVTRDELLAVRTDSLGIESIVIYTLGGR